MSKTFRVASLGFIALIATAFTNAQDSHEAPAATQGASTPAPTGTVFDGSAEEGAAKAGTCVACHGLNGQSTNPEWPQLAGQNAVYIGEQLKLFRAGTRNNPIMMPMAQTLSDDDINDLAVYYSRQTPKGQEADPSYWKAGEDLYRNGDVKRNIPACMACHGPVGHGNPAAGYPALIAQHSVYTVKQLNDYVAGARYVKVGDKPASSRNGYMMETIAKRLTAEDIRNLASYIQGMR